MRAQRIKTGFHRIGVVLAAICLAWAAACFSYFLHYGQGANGGLYGGIASVVVAAIVYLFARAVGWIIAGFMGDGVGQASN
jgi:hypothetical protein